MLSDKAIQEAIKILNTLMIKIIINSRKKAEKDFEIDYPKRSTNSSNDNSSHLNNIDFDEYFLQKYMSDQERLLLKELNKLFKSFNKCKSYSPLLLAQVDNFREIIREYEGIINNLVILTVFETSNEMCHSSFIPLRSSIKKNYDTLVNTLAEVKKTIQFHLENINEDSSSETEDADILPFFSKKESNKAFHNSLNKQEEFLKKHYANKVLECEKIDAIKKLFSEIGLIFSYHRTDHHNPRYYSASNLHQRIDHLILKTVDGCHIPDDDLDVFTSCIPPDYGLRFWFKDNISIRRDLSDQYAKKLSQHGLFEVAEPQNEKNSSLDLNYNQEMN